MPRTIDSYRTFIAIELSGDIRARIVAHIARLRRELPDVRASWLREDNLHLTLKFFGNIPVGRVPTLSDAVAAAAEAIDPFELIVSGCRTFPPQGRPNVLWIGIDSHPGGADFEAATFLQPTPASHHPLIALHRTLEDECDGAGFERDLRPFHPHLTIARLRESRGSRELAEHHQQLGFAPQTFTVSELVIFRSELSSKGSKHTVLSRHELG